MKVSRELPKRRHKWSKKFVEIKNRVIEDKAQTLAFLEEQRKSYRPQTVDSTTVTNFIDKELEVVPIPFDENASPSRNKICLFCLQSITNAKVIMKCKLCPAITHSKCYESIINNKNYNNKIYAEYKDSMLVYRNDAQEWHCPDCTFEITAAKQHERNRLQADRRKRTEFFSALHLQASLMRHKEEKNYYIVRNGMLRLQARVSSLNFCSFK